MVQIRFISAWNCYYWRTLSMKCWKLRTFEHSVFIGLVIGEWAQKISPSNPNCLFCIHQGWENIKTGFEDFNPLIVKFEYGIVRVLLTYGDLGILLHYPLDSELRNATQFYKNHQFFRSYLSLLAIVSQITPKYIWSKPVDSRMSRVATAEKHDATRFSDSLAYVIYDTLLRVKKWPNICFIMACLQAHREPRFFFCLYCIR